MLPIDQLGVAVQIQPPCGRAVLVKQGHYARQDASGRCWKAGALGYVEATRSAVEPIWSASWVATLEQQSPEPSVTVADLRVEDSIMEECDHHPGGLPAGG